MDEGGIAAQNIYDKLAYECGTEKISECALKIGTYVQYSLWIYVITYAVAWFGMLLLLLYRPLGSLMWISWLIYNVSN